MNKKLLIGIAVAVALVIAIALVARRDGGTPGPSGTSGDRLAVPDPRNATYLIEGEQFPLKNGEALVQTEQGVSTRYEYFREAPGLLNEDNIEDVGVILTGDPDGTATFYYAVALVSTEAGWQTTNAILLGDRIAPEIVDVGSDKFIITYKDRKPGEPFTTAPSVSVTKQFQVRKGVLVEVKK